jgi:predicted PurR-regulated permease PerM
VAIDAIHSESPSLRVAGPLDVLPSPRPRSSWATVIVAWWLTLGAAYVARDVLIPVALSVLLALVLRPLLRRLQRLHVQTLPASLAIVVIVALLTIAGTATLAGQGQKWLAEAPQTVERVRRMLPVKSGPLSDLSKATEAVRDLAQSESTEAAVPVEVRSAHTTFTILGASGHFLGSLVVVFVLAFFLLAFSDDLLRQAISSRPSWSEKRNVVQLIQNVENGVSRYLATITIINIGLGAVTACALWLLGIPNPVLWGVMAATLNYVPHVGAFVCMAVLFFVGAVAHESLWYGAGVAAVFSLITSIESYLVTPLVLSRSLQLSPLAVIVAILFLGWIWGIAGGLMAAPLLAVVKIVCDQFNSLHTFGAILGGESSGAVARTAS